MRLAILTSFILVFGTLICSAQNLYFPPITGDSWETRSPTEFNWCQDKIDSLYAFLDSNDTKVFIVLKDGKIVLEKYFGSHNEKTPWYWASAGKSLTAFLVGMAEQEKFLFIQDTSSKYLGVGWTSLSSEQEEKIKIWHQLTMTSGLDDGVENHYCTDDTCLKFLADPGTRWAYHNGPYTLLDKVMESATGLTMNQFTNQKLKPLTGITGSFLKVDYNNVFYSTARSMARFGLLVLNKGNWNGNQLLTDTNYFNQMVNSSQDLNPAYGYLWWLNGKESYLLPGFQYSFRGSVLPDAPDDLIAALGKNGQFLNVVPSQNLVLVRMGNAPTTVDVPHILNNQIWKYLNELNCDALGLNNLETNSINIYPNPTQKDVQLDSKMKILYTQLLDNQGRLLKTEESSTLNLEEYPKGIYFIQIFLENGSSLSERVVKF